MTLLVSLIVAAAENGVIGRAGELPWRLRSDLRLFRRLTMGKPMIMGRKTYQSIGKPLDGRDNIVVTRNRTFSAPGIIVEPTLEAALDHARDLARQRQVDEIMVIGGAEIFREAMPAAGRIYLTQVHGTPEGDTFLPVLPSGEWREVSREILTPDPADEFACTLIVLERKRQGNLAADTPA